MSKLIVEMEMPENCRSCPFSSGCSFCEGYDDYCVLAPKDAKYEWNFSDGKEPKERPDWCPIKGELVRCGECKHRDPEDKRCDCGGHEWVKGKILPVKDDWFCADGERKDGERDGRTD